MSDDLDLPPFLKRTGATPMPDQAAAEPKKRTIRPDAIVATITIALPVDKKADDLLDKWSAVKVAVANAETSLKELDGVVVTVDRAKLGKMP